MATNKFISFSYGKVIRSTFIEHYNPLRLILVTYFTEINFQVKLGKKISVLLNKIAFNNANFNNCITKRFTRYQIKMLIVKIDFNLIML